MEEAGSVQALSASYLGPYGVYCRTYDFHRSLTAAVATLLAFDCYLRVGELFNLTRSDFVDGDQDGRLGSGFHGLAPSFINKDWA